MGELIAESNSVPTHIEEIFVENEINDSKKKKRRSRKSKPTLLACSSVSNICQNASTLSDNVVSNGHHRITDECSASSSYMPMVDPNEQQTIDENLQNQQLNPHEEPILCNPEAVGTVLIPRPIDYNSRRTYFPPHRSADAVNKALEKGELLRALFHVNAHNRLEAYCKIDGVQTDVLISGALAQNRAIEGDTVAIVLDPPSQWPRMKGITETRNNPSLHINSNEVHSGGKSKFNPESDNSGDVNSYKNGSYFQATIDNGYDRMSLLEKLCAFISVYPTTRPTGKVVSVVEKSSRRENIVGFLSIKQWLSNRESRKKNKSHFDLDHGFIVLTPTDPKFTKLMVHVRSLPGDLKKRLEAGDLTIESDLVAVEIVDWAEECYIPDACVVRIFGRGGDVAAQISAILFENSIHASEFSPEALSCLPRIPWEVPREEFDVRRDLRNLCIFTIDPANATDLDDALSLEKLPDGVFRVGVHIADVSYFVLPDTALDIDAQIRSTSVYLLKRKLSMLPPMLSDNLASLNPGVDRLAFSIFWDISSEGEALDRWIGRTIIRSCSKLSYEDAQEIIDGSFNRMAKVYGPYGWRDVIDSLKSLHEISKILRENRFERGALSLGCPKLVFLYDEDGVPYDSVVSGLKDSNYLVEEFMLLANRTAAEVITRTYPSRALLRRHPEPNARKLREFEAFCSKIGLELDASSSASLHDSLERLRGELKNDSVLIDILMSYAARPMQLAAYSSSGDFKDVCDYGHYALAVPLYTHFTSPLRRYPDIVVHRTLAAALEAEDIYSNGKIMSGKASEGEILGRCFSGVCFDKNEIESVEAREALSLSASKYRVPGSETLADVAAHCNERERARRHVKDATNKLYTWVLLKKKEILYCEARVLGLGPKFMSIYIPKLAIERRIYYDEVDGLSSEWLDTTSTLVLSRSTKKQPVRKTSTGKSKTIGETALIVSPTELNFVEDDHGELRWSGSDMIKNEPAFYPLTVHLLSTVPVALHAVGGDDGPLDIVARLYISSYFH